MANRRIGVLSAHICPLSQIRNHSISLNKSSSSSNEKRTQGYENNHNSLGKNPRDREYYKHWLQIQTRWSDNDQYSHVNNAIYYHYFDTIVNQYLISKCGLEPQNSTDVGLVVSSSCNYFTPIKFPTLLEAGLVIINFGNSSVKYRIGIFEKDVRLAAAYGDFVHCFVDRSTMVKKTISGQLKLGMQKILLD